MSDDETPEHESPEEREEPEVIFDPALGRFVRLPSKKEPLHPSDAYLRSWVMAMATVGVVFWCLFLFFGSLALFCSGGPASSSGLLTAAVLGVSLLLAATALVFRLRRRLGRIGGAFAALYLLGLVTLFALSPLLWPC